MMRAADIHARIGSAWPWVLEQLGIDGRYLRNAHGPCPCCGGVDRFRFMNRDRSRGVDVGAWYCNGCGGRDGNGGAGDGFALLQRVHRWSFAEARSRVLAVLGIDSRPALSAGGPPPPRSPSPTQTQGSGPPRRALGLLRTSCAVADCAAAVRYLQSRHCWPLPAATALRAHAAADYFDQAQHVGRYPALVAPLVDPDGEILAVHVTYLQADGQKLAALAPRKIHGRYGDRRGLAVRLMPATGEALGIAEGIETALSAARLHSLPVWAALNAGLLAKFVPPPSVHRVIIFADRDVAGLQAAYALREELDGRALVELRTPPPPHNDWNDAHAASIAASHPEEEFP